MPCRDMGNDEETLKTIVCPCWLCQSTINTLECSLVVDAKGRRWESLLPMVNCEGCGALLDAAWIQDMVGYHMADESDSVCYQTLSRLEKMSQGHSRWKKSVLQRFIGIVFSSFVTLQVTAVFLGNVFVIFPGIVFQNTYVRSQGAIYTIMVAIQCIALGLYSATIILYWTVVLHHPGRVPTRIDTKQGCIGYQWCHVCDALKPPQAHHCRRCGTCILELDHHCVYTGNTCIGRETMSYFVYFLIALVIGSGISSMASMAYFWVHRRVLVSHYVAAWRFHLGRDTTRYPSVYILRLYLFMKNWICYTSEFEDIVWIDVLISSLAACLGGTSILLRQLRYLNKGTTYLEETLLLHKSKKHPE